MGQSRTAAPAVGEEVIGDPSCGHADGRLDKEASRQFIPEPGAVPEPNGAQTGLFSERPTIQRKPRLMLSNEWATASVTLFVEGLIITVLSVGTGIVYSLMTFGNLGVIVNFVSVGILTAALFCGIVRVMGGHNSLKSSSGLNRARDALIAWVAIFFLLTSVFFTMKAGAEFSRGAVLTFFGLGLFVVTAARSNIPVLLAWTRRKGLLNQRNVIVIGGENYPTVNNFIRELRRGICPDPMLVTLDVNCIERTWPEERKKVIQKIYALARQSGPGEIFVSAEGLTIHRLESLLRGLSLLPRPVLVIPDSRTEAIFRYPKTTAFGCVAVEVQGEPMNRMQQSIKRMIDIVGASVLFLVSSPLMAAIAVAIWFQSPGPVIFRQTRNGYRGRPFKIYKFRSMTVWEDGDTIVQAQQNDKRFTRIGRWLRKNSLDELPQLLNVIKGEMSLVGPRPHAVAHDALYIKTVENYELRQLVKPGMTGWAQVNGLRGETLSHDLMYQRIEHDLWYARHASINQDLKILALTIPQVLKHHNVY